GEVTGVGGAALALVEGRLAGLAAADRALPVSLLRRRESLRRFASAMAAIHRVEPGVPEDVLVCRCEDVKSTAIRRACAELGVVDGRGAKLMTRAGMGWCQGRVCGHAVAHLVASAHERPVTAADLLAFANRPIAQPITLHDLADRMG
ncbi:(2Fe-2S)-binding protein, partial [Allorhizocola rhizosphaerae]|uniref:(2Fe-2S)-binding protein n=1 Tax=Allorhizocola rhizosphaerae TaxID=1872709 RepID=UPI001478B81E